MTKNADAATIPVRESVEIQRYLWGLPPVTR